MRGLLVFLLAAGCRFELQGVAIGGADGAVDLGAQDLASGSDLDEGDGPPADGSPGGDLNGPCASWGYSPSNVTCTSPVATLTTAAGTNTLDTGTGMLMPAGTVVCTDVVSASGAHVCLASLSGLMVPSGSTLTLAGPKPFVALVHGTATIAGVVDASATATTPGPGGDDGACGNGGPGGNDSGGGSGGGGGGFGGGGGGGGQTAVAGGTAGAAATGSALIPLRGGCKGGKGGNGAGTGGGEGGHGGGAIQISARDMIDISGTIRAGGSGGRGGDGSGANAEEGGGGGGSGGAILLESTALAVTGDLCANGGAGGEGSGTNTNGSNGADATCQESTGATSGDASGSGGNGGTGGYRATPAGGTGSNQAGAGSGGAGGGGGGVGRIHARNHGSSPTPAVLTPNWLYETF